MSDKFRLLQEQREGLTNTTSGTTYSYFDHFIYIYCFFIYEKSKEKKKESENEKGKFGVLKF